MPCAVCVGVGVASRVVPTAIHNYARRPPHYFSRLDPSVLVKYPDENFQRFFADHFKVQIPRISREFSVSENSRKVRKTSPKNSQKILGKFPENSRKVPGKFPRKFRKIPGK